MELRATFTQTAGLPLAMCKPNKTRCNTIWRNNNMIFMPKPLDETTLEIIIQHLINEQLIREALAL
jgi:hypothetical protein